MHVCPLIIYIYKYGYEFVYKYQFMPKKRTYLCQAFVVLCSANYIAITL